MVLNRVRICILKINLLFVILVESIITYPEKLISIIRNGLERSTPIINKNSKCLLEMLFLFFSKYLHDKSEKIFTQKIQFFFIKREHISFSKKRLELIRTLQTLSDLLTHCSKFYRFHFCQIRIDNDYQVRLHQISLQNVWMMLAITNNFLTFQRRLFLYTV